jgi:uncharacterized Zn finger protein
MKCPNCYIRTEKDIEMKQGKFSVEHTPVRKCRTCGLIWRIKMKTGELSIDIIKTAATL